MDENNKNMAEDTRRESGEPGGGQGRRDEVGQSPVYPVSADKMPDDNEAYIRTPGEFGQRGRGLEGYSDHGGSGLTGLSSDGGGSETTSSQSAQAGANQPAKQNTASSKVPGAGEETAASDTVDSDQDPPTHGHGDINRF